MIDDVIARLEAQVAELQSRTFGAAEFTTLMQRKSLPAFPVAAYVLPLGLQGSAATAAASCRASGAERLVIEVPNNRRESSSSSGSAGMLVKLISGFCA